MTEINEKPICPHCGSDDISVDGAAIWSADIQDWVLSCTYDGYHCEACDREFKHPEWKTKHDEHQS